MIRFAFLLLCWVGSFVVGSAQTIPAKAATVQFFIRNAGFTVDGSFSQVQVSLTGQRANPATWQLTASAPVATITTGIEARDRHLLKPDYFDAARFPQLTFVSASFSQVEGRWIALGRLTIKGTTREVRIPVTVDSGQELVLKGEFTLNRLEYGVGSSSWVMADDVRVVVTLRF